MRDQLKKAGLFSQVDKRVWNKRWVVDLEPVGSGEAAFRYLAPYVFRVALSNKRILKLEDGVVTFKYKESATKQVKLCPLSAEEFIRRFLQHVLPHRFVKVRYYGLLSPGNRKLLAQARELLGPGAAKPNSTDRDAQLKERPAAPCCPHCGSVLILLRLRELKPSSGRPP